MCNLITLLGVSVAAFVIIPASISAQVIEATCVVAKNSGVGIVEGTIRLSQTTGQNLSIAVSLSGFSATATETLHGFHVHTAGDLGNQCNNTLGHYNPDNVDHAGPQDSPRHVGDWGNIHVNPDGTSSLTFTDNIVQLSGARSVIGLGIVVHEMQDDLGKGNYSDSLTTGHAGRRLGCCTIVPSGASTTSAMILQSLTLALFSLGLLLFNTRP